MGLCLSRNSTVKKRPTSRRLTNQSAAAAVSGGAVNGSNRWSRNRSTKRDDSLIQERALAAAILFQQQLQNGGGGGGAVPFDRSTSLRYPNLNSKKNQPLPRSSSSRARSLTDPLLQPHQLVSNQELKVDDLETNHFVLVHGGGFGAWCWYKTIALLEEAGFKVTAIDLTGSGIHSFDTNSIASLSQYVQPLTDFLEKLADGEKVILVGHDFGGACISFAMELYSFKVSKAVFVAAAMLTSGQSALDIFSQKTDSNDLMRQSQIFIYANGNDKPPTAIDLDKSLLRDLLFNHSPAKDVALASVSMRPIPFSPVLEKLCLSDSKYGSVRRFYIETAEDNAIPIALQQSMVSNNPPERAFHLKGADHSPFFSKPQALHRLLVEISRIQST
ncbi:putative methylesterase 11, chloroplastic [Nicotiana tabacum]|uniref:Methylesterase 11, chloroplastic n=1 Tax=Nicotiana tabacum TaxID=4097 RepID=A0A1S4AM41_TOBAC|nr:PREDICTED: putative methylesterase 11, chloroplastic [Nicotiana tabacum]